VDDSGTPEISSPKFSGLSGKACRALDYKRQYGEHGVVSLVWENAGLEK